MLTSLGKPQLYKALAMARLSPVRRHSSRHGLVVLHGQGHIRPPVGDSTRGFQRVGVCGRVSLHPWHGQDAIQPARPFRKQASHLPEAPERVAQAKGRFGRAVLDGPGQGGPKVAVLDVQAVEEPLSVRARQAGSGRLGEVPVQTGMLLGDRGRDLEFRQSLQGELADHQQHRETRVAVRLVLPDQALIHQSPPARRGRRGLAGRRRLLQPPDRLRRRIRRSRRRAAGPFRPAGRSSRLWHLAASAASREGRAHRNSVCRGAGSSGPAAPVEGGAWSGPPRARWRVAGRRAARRSRPRSPRWRR